MTHCARDFTAIVSLTAKGGLWPGVSSGDRNRVPVTIGRPNVPTSGHFGKVLFPRGPNARSKCEECLPFAPGPIRRSHDSIFKFLRHVRKSCRDVNLIGGGNHFPIAGQIFEHDFLIVGSDGNVHTVIDVKPDNI
jgi:hypothetical protein